jgi:hypothetical protein
MGLKGYGQDILKIVTVLLFYVLVLLFIAPIVDHTFTPLHKEDTNMEILIEVLLQLITVSVLWFYLSKYMFRIADSYIHIRYLTGIQNIIGIASGVLLIGLQKNLLNKLRYITNEHPFRYITFFDKITPTFGIHRMRGLQRN